LIGNINSQRQEYEPPRHRIESGENRTWFVVIELRSRGSGIAGYDESWYEITKDKVNEVLSYPARGHDIPCSGYLGRSYTSLLLRHGSLNGAYTVPIQFLISYNISDCEKGTNSPLLFTKDQLAYFVWSEAQGRFVLDAARSGVTEDELDSAYSPVGLSRKRFLALYPNELLGLARDGEPNQKAWLTRFLEDVEEGPAKTRLQRALGN
jgi:hypothetical protein